MHICKTLDYIVDTDLHLYFFTKLVVIRSKGIRIEIELTEPIFYLPVDSLKYIEIVDMFLDNSTDLLMKSSNKKLNLYMFYTERDLHLVIKYPSAKVRLNETLGTSIKKNKNFQIFTDNKKGETIQHLIVQ